MINHLIHPRFLPASIDVGLLILRLGVAGTLFLKHGPDKILHYSETVARFPSLFGLDPTTTFAIAFISDMICSALVVLGLFTRLTALFICCNLTVAWIFVHNLQFYQGDHGEMISYLLWGILALVFTGAGRFSLDHQLSGRQPVERSEQIPARAS